ncbi:kinase-like domain-containing protein [Rhizophagus clarus]|uniref:Kinase-like domain-containing protein n=1 Tax=Rhizophagus clarus TaxID=94130 RepID=A0A8H3MDQ5_9GLOM|nr:kinase-like domain-containing protein [Rhizophagus clarus]
MDSSDEINYFDKLCEWCGKFVDIKEIGKNDISVSYSAKWGDGPLEYNTDTKKRERNPNKIIKLKSFHGTRFLYEVKSYPISECSDDKIYGISQNPVTRNYIIVFNDEYFCKYHCKNCGKICTNIQYRCNMKDGPLEYADNGQNKRNKNKEINLKCFSTIQDKNESLIKARRSCQIIYLKESFTSWTSGNKGVVTKWKDGPLEYNKDIKKYKRNPNEATEEIYLKYSHNIGNIYEFLNEAEKYHITSIYGISQIQIQRITS